MAAHDFAIGTMEKTGGGKDKPGKPDLKHGTMRLNIRFAAAFCRILSTELESIDHHFSSQDADGPKTSHITDIVLPCLRLCIFWLVSYHGNLVVPVENELYNLFEDLHRSVARVGSSIMTLAQTQTDLLKEAPYMLIEDELALGLKRLSSAELPFGCRLGYFEGTDTRKPSSKTADGDQLNLYQETFCRIFDITRGIYFLAAKNHMPIDIETITDSNGQLSLRYNYRASGQVDEQPMDPQPASQQPMTAAPMAELHSNQASSTGYTMPSGQVSQIEQPMWSMVSVHRSPPPPPQEPSSPKITRLRYEDSVARQVYRPAPAYDRSAMNRTATPLEPHVEADLLQRLQNYVLPPEVEGRMGTNINDTNTSQQTGSPVGIAATATSPIPARATPVLRNNGSQHGAFPTLPWSYFVNPQPTTNNGATLEAPPANQLHSAHAANTFTGGNTQGFPENSTAAQLFQQYHAERSRTQHPHGNANRTSGHGQPRPRS
jgi:hypothetical protein